MTANALLNIVINLLLKAVLVNIPALLGIKDTIAYLKTTLIFLITCLFITQSKVCFTQDKFPELRGSYLGQTPPGKTPKIFAPGIISSDTLLEMGCTWMPDGKEFYFTTSNPTSWTYNLLMVTKYKNGEWTEPENSDLKGHGLYWGNCFLPGGERLYFRKASFRRGHFQENGRLRTDLWHHRDGDGIDSNAGQRRR